MRRKRRGFSLTRAHNQCWCVYDYEKGCQNNSTSPLNSNAKKKINALKLFSLRNSPKGGARPNFRLPELHTKQGGTQTKRRDNLIPKKAPSVALLRGANKVLELAKALMAVVGNNFSSSLPALQIILRSLRMTQCGAHTVQRRNWIHRMYQPLKLVLADTHPLLAHIHGCRVRCLHEFLSGDSSKRGSLMSRIPSSCPRTLMRW